MQPEVVWELEPDVGVEAVEQQALVQGPEAELSVLVLDGASVPLVQAVAEVGLVLELEAELSGVVRLLSSLAELVVALSEEEVCLRKWVVLQHDHEVVRVVPRALHH